ncbi:helix-turn-helix domain-containing protein [Francisella sp. TX07-6608]|uniref:helix-turn-helix domain-containing protein n=1 Tax=Francisella sp. TX07-6608 TaxID=573568 RepID=UPI0008F9BFF6|nr:helix-turn-helix domain-containing protein [Francisella sp. TX07-6608]OIN84984.1 helix-turn-helix domain protein [Francisella sp. TX07-6608]
MKKYKHLSYEELVKIETLLSSGYDEKEIAIKLSRNKSCIYRCLKKNSIDGKFIANVAYEKIRERKLKSNKPRRILPGSILSQYVVEKNRGVLVSRADC